MTYMELEDRKLNPDIELVSLKWSFSKIIGMMQAKVLTRFDSLQKALKNYTISATPEDRSSVLQQVSPFLLVCSFC
jgi:hypothetical protein